MPQCGGAADAAQRKRKSERVQRIRLPPATVRWGGWMHHFVELVDGVVVVGAVLARLRLDIPPAELDVSKNR
jgi:hypothetical protein